MILRKSVSKAKKEGVICPWPWDSRFIASWHFLSFLEQLQTLKILISPTKVTKAFLKHAKHTVRGAAAAVAMKFIQKHRNIEAAHFSPGLWISLGTTNEIHVEPSAHGLRPGEYDCYPVRVQVIGSVGLIKLCNSALDPKISSSLNASVFLWVQPDQTHRTCGIFLGTDAVCWQGFYCGAWNSVLFLKLDLWIVAGKLYPRFSANSLDCGHHTRLHGDPPFS